MINKSHRSNSIACILAVAMTLLMMAHANAQPPLNWGAAAGQNAAEQNETAKDALAIKRSLRKQSPLDPAGASNLRERAEDLNPQPLPPAKPKPGDPIKSAMDSRVRPLPAPASSVSMPNQKLSEEFKTTEPKKWTEKIGEKTGAKAGGKASDKTGDKAAQKSPTSSSSGEERAIIIVGGKQAVPEGIKN